MALGSYRGNKTGKGSKDEKRTGNSTVSTKAGIASGRDPANSVDLTKGFSEDG